jgi:hypothetical protein
MPSWLRRWLVNLTLIGHEPSAPSVIGNKQCVHVGVESLYEFYHCVPSDIDQIPWICKSATLAREHSRCDKAREYYTWAKPKDEPWILRSSRPPVCWR